MLRRTLLLSTMVAAVVVIPTWTAPSPMKKSQPKTIINSIGMKLTRIEPGTFTMGSRENDDQHPHEVKITKAFYLGVYSVTQAEYEKVMEENPSRYSTKNADEEKVKGLDTSKFPVEKVSWQEAQKFCEKLSALAKEKAAGRKYCLPTEAEWEYACRAGTKTTYHSGDGEDILKKVAWYTENSGGRTHEVGAKKPNAWGLYDMHGNVFQWCSDWYDRNYYQTSDKNDPKGPENGDSRVLRGGAWNFNAAACTAAYRLFDIDACSSTGFRVVCVPSAK